MICENLSININFELCISNHKKYLGEVIYTNRYYESAVMAY